MNKYYLCSKQGTSSAQVHSASERRRVNDRDECSAMVGVLKKSNSEKWVISVFVEEHTHQLTTPRRVHLLRSHRGVSATKKQLSMQLDEANIPMCQQIAILEMQAGGTENMGCTPKGLYNHKRNLRKEMDGHDVELLIEHFTGKQSKNSAFYYKMDIDGEDRLNRCFWADAKSIQAYKFYGDVVVFDTTYNTNRYEMKFAPFVGVNKHGQTIVFACAFLSNEKIESFLWVFDQFKKAMPSSAPKMIITDQAAAIANVVAQEFPETLPRLCIWHIQQKISSKLDANSPLYDYKKFHHCIWESETPEEFDSKWAVVLEETQTTGNNWLESIFQLRSKWVPAYVNHVFSAGMASSQRVESSHAFFKRYVSRQNSLMEFIILFNRALGRQRDVELEKDHIDLNSKPLLKSPMAMEGQMASIYTGTMFQKFQHELWDIMACVVHLAKEDDRQIIYNVVQRTTKGKLKERTVIYERDLEYAWCSCKKFESEGIPCRHLLAYLRMTAQHEFLPNAYICHRWTKAANSEVVLDEDGFAIQDGTNCSLITHKSNLSKLSSQIIDEALVSEMATMSLYQMFEGDYEKIKQMVGNSSYSMVGSTTRCESTSASRSQQIINPLIVGGKGSGKRLMGGK